MHHSNDNQEESEVLLSEVIALTNGLNNADAFDLLGDEFKNILKMYGAEEVDLRTVDKVKTMLKIKFELYGRDFDILFNKPDTRAIYDKYMGIKLEGRSEYWVLNLQTKEIEHRYSGRQAESEANAFLHDTVEQKDISRVVQEFNRNLENSE